MKKYTILLVILIFLATCLVCGGAYVYVTQIAKPKMSSPVADNKVATDSEANSVNAADIVECDKIADSNERSDCYWTANLKLHDPAVCAKITDHYKKSSCYKNVAAARLDISFCEIVNDDTSRESCYSAVAVAKKDATVCNVSKSQEIIDACYREVARATLNTSLCEKIAKAYTKDWCYDNIAEDKKDASICAMVSDQEKRDECYSAIARSRKDISICAKVQKESLDGCYYNVADATEDASICEKMTDADYKTLCFSSVALRTNDPSVCGKISDPSDKKDCLKGTGRPVVDESKGCVKEGQVCSSTCCSGLTCEFNDDKGYSYCINKPSTCGNGTCDSGETDINCNQDCCAKDGEAIDITGTKRCCEGLVANPNCIACAKNSWTCRNFFCGNGLCETSRGETATLCPLDCGWSGTCAKEGEMARWMTASPDGSGYFRDCCEGLMQLADHGYDSRCEEWRTWDVTLCVKNCGDGQCTKGENKCNCPQDCK